jgi:hypothetical protein
MLDEQPLNCKICAVFNSELRSEATLLHKLNLEGVLVGERPQDKRFERHLILLIKKNEIFLNK